MVLQRGKPDTIWGWSKPGERVRVQIGERSATGTAGTDHRWEVKIEPPAPGGPYTVTISGAQNVELHNVLVGDVWICGGQSWSSKETNSASSPLLAAIASGTGPERGSKAILSSSRCRRCIPRKCATHGSPIPRPRYSTAPARCAIQDGRLARHDPKRTAIPSAVRRWLRPPLLAIGSTTHNHHKPEGALDTSVNPRVGCLPLTLK
jgi:hypothetical protein